jgi:hypothetical protein
MYSETMDMNVDNYTIPELEEMFQLRKPYTYEEVMTRIDDYDSKVVSGKDGEAFKSFLGAAQIKFKLELESRRKSAETTHPVMFPTVYNPHMKHTTTRIVNIDSKYRQDIAGSATEFTFDLGEHLTNIKGIRLYAIHIPTTWYAFSKKYGNTRIWVDDINEVNIPDGNYTPESLVSQMQAEMVSKHIDVSWNYANFKTTITNHGSVSHSLTFYAQTDASYDFSTGCEQRTKLNNSLGWALGWRGMGETVSVDLTSVTPTTFPAAIDTYGPRYFYLVLDDFTNAQLSRGLVNMHDFANHNADNRAADRWKYDRVRPPSNPNVLAIISVDKIKPDERGIIPYINSGLEFNTRAFSSPVDISRMKVSLIDDRGNVVDLNGADWSFSLLVEQQL